MNESDAKLKTCPQLFAAVTISATSAVHNGASQEAVKELMSKGCCHGSLCMMWEPEYKTENHETTETQDEKDSKPDGDGWYVSGRLSNGNRPATINWRRHVPIDTGDCGLKQLPIDCRASC